jgi:hypothetical protein
MGNLSSDLFIPRWIVSTVGWAEAYCVYELRQCVANVNQGRDELIRTQWGCSEGFSLVLRGTHTDDSNMAAQFVLEGPSAFFVKPCECADAGVKSMTSAWAG